MKITSKEIKELVGTTLKDLPRLPLTSLLHCGDCESYEIECIAKYITNHYSSEEVLEAVENNLKWWKNYVNKFCSKRKQKCIAQNVGTPLPDHE